MAQETDIEWSDLSSQVTSGCKRKSPGCGDGAIDGKPMPGGGCYAERLAHKLSFNPKVTRYRGITRAGPKGKGPRFTGLARVNHDELLALLALTRGDPKRIFIDSMADLFYEALTDDDLDCVFGVFLAMAVLPNRPHHTLLVLTKRADHMHAYLTGATPEALVRRWARAAEAYVTTMNGTPYASFSAYVATLDLAWLFPLPNVMLGVSCEAQPWFDERAPLLAATPAAGRFYSMEPLLGRVTMTRLLGERHGAHYETIPHSSCGMPRQCDCACAGCLRDKQRPPGAPDEVIVGSESGPRARGMDEEWVRALRDECLAAGIKFFYKQKLESGPTVGARRRKVSLPILDGQQWVEQHTLPRW